MIVEFPSSLNGLEATRFKPVSAHQRSSRGVSLSVPSSEHRPAGDGSSPSRQSRSNVLIMGPGHGVVVADACGQPRIETIRLNFSSDSLSVVRMTA